VPDRLLRRTTGDDCASSCRHDASSSSLVVQKKMQLLALGARDCLMLLLPRTKDRRQTQQGQTDSMP
jgi:hypothetical protein